MLANVIVLYISQDKLMNRYGSIRIKNISIYLIKST